MHKHLPILIVLLALLGTTPLLAQDGSSLPSQREDEPRKVRFNGLGRTILNQTEIAGNILNSDTTTARQLTDGEFLLDLAINATPTDNAEVQGILRLRNEFGGFFGAGVTVEIRELWARGIIANAVGYRVGDFDYALTPYTFFNFTEEGHVNEAELFRPQREVIYYEQFYGEGNTRRLQGAKLDFGLNFPVLLQSAEIEGFIARIRPTDFFTQPTRFVTGGRLDLVSQTLQDSLGLRIDAGLNLSHVFDDLRSGNATTGIRNTVWSVDFDVTVLDNDNLGLHLRGEAGQSSLTTAANSGREEKEDDTFLEAGLELMLKPANVSVFATYLDVGPDFFSIGAQSRRVDYDRRKTFYNRIGNDRQLRAPTLFDLGRDRALYTYQLSDQLMAYDPRYTNVMPYGQATPNRRGLQAGASYGDATQPLEVTVTASVLGEIRGQGTFELRDLTQLRAMANLNLNQWLDWRKNLRLTLGWQQEQVSRGGLEIEAVDLRSTLLDVGLEAELFPRFDLLLGAKLMTAEGSDYLPLIEEFNDVRDFPGRYIADDQETLAGAGVRYRFGPNIYLTLQYHQFQLERSAMRDNDYDLNQVFAQYIMQF